MSSDHCRPIEVLVTLDVCILRPAPANRHNHHIMVTSGDNKQARAMWVWDSKNELSNRLDNTGMRGVPGVL